MKGLCFLVLNLIFFVSVSGQTNSDTTKLVAYDFSYEFRDGIYLNFEQFRDNNPINFSRTNLPHPSQMDTESAMQESGGLEYFDEYGNSRFVSIEQVWGYAYNDKVYIFWSGEFHLLSYVGSISHFVARVTVYHNRMNDPFYDPYYMYSAPSSYASTETVQLLLDMFTGKIYYFTTQNVSGLLKSEPELQREFLSLRKRKRQKLMFYYIRQYNEKNPLYFPAN